MIMTLKDMIIVHPIYPLTCKNLKKKVLKNYVCSSFSAVGVIVPLGICLIIVLVYFYLRCRQRRLRRRMKDI
jgi:Gpi18-like mannosyltransferase